MTDVRLEYIDGRYLLEDDLGAGGMGIVYRSFDRLTLTHVALKRVTIPPEYLELLESRPHEEGDDFRLGLAHEFSLLATLRHPNIISVLDFGFDADRQPFFTMELLDESLPLLEAGRFLQPKDRLVLLVQVLQALDYLHRRGVIHRDLKSENVLIQNNRAKVLDFGLSVSRDYRLYANDELSGTLQYVSPEVFDGQPVSEKSDLYAIGVMAYELFAGRHPFDVESLDVVDFVKEVKSTAPDLAMLDLPPGLSKVIGQLLAKAPDDRPASAHTAIKAFSDAAGEALSTETVAIRESYLEAARFVGREPELQLLSDALGQVESGEGDAWLVAGESGVGKTRLLSELRIQALVQGFHVLHGHTEQTGRVTYQPWREVLRSLVLLVQPSDLEAEILKAIVPDIDRLLGRPVGDVTELEADKARTRLFTTVVDLFRRVERSVLLILEDLHWAGPETLALTQWVSQAASSLPLMLIGSFRNDEYPRLPDVLSTMQILTLERLTSQGVSLLSQSMLGDVGREPEVVELLQRESEGNVFFMIEVVRFLAEEAGQLDRVSMIKIPDRVFAGGMQAILERRLGKVAESARPLLRFAALYGRRLDLVVLRPLAPSVSLENWLTDCADLAVLDVKDDHWRFAHDKLREVVLAQIAPSDLPGLHEQIALAIEASYADTTEQAGRLAFHWAEAGNTEKELHYSILAGRHAARRFAFDEAIQHLQRSHDLAPNDISIMYDLARIWETTGNLNAAEKIASEAIALPVSCANSKRLQAFCQWFLGNLLAHYRGDYELGYRFLEAARRAFEAAGEVKGLIEVWSSLGRAHLNRAEYDVALDCFERQGDLAARIGDRSGQSTAERNIGHIYAQQGDHTQALQRYENALAIALDTGDYKPVAAAYSSLGVLYSNMGELTKAHECSLLQLENYGKVGDIVRYSDAIVTLGAHYLAAGGYAEALACCTRGLDTCVKIGDKLGASIGLIYCAECLGGETNYPQAERAAMLAIELIRDLQKLYHLAGYLITAAEILLQQGKYSGAKRLVAEAVETAERIKSRDFQFKASLQLVRVRRSLGELSASQAVQTLEAMLDEWTDAEEQADIRYTIWELDNTQVENGRFAAERYRELFAASPQYTYRQRFEKITGQALSGGLELPPLPPDITPLGPELAPLMERVEAGLAVPSGQTHLGG